MTTAVAAAAPSTAARLTPYVGPQPYTRDNVKAGIELYGRDRDVDHIVDLLASRRIVQLYSPSGAGKTSLIHAKLIGALEDDNYHVLPVVRAGPEPRREGTPFAELHEANRYVLSTLQCLESALPAEQRTPPVQLAALDLPTWFDRFEVPESKFPIIIFDQFEEILTADPTDRAAKEVFFAQLGTMLRNRERWALVAMREDFIAALDPYRNSIPTRLRETYRLDLLNEAAAFAAITEPAKHAGVPFSDEAARKVLDELRLTKVERPDGSTDTVMGEYVEPVQLQVVCLNLWQRLPVGVSEITVAHVRQFGDVNQALFAFYERTLAITSRTSHVSIGRLRAWFAEELVTSGGTRGLVYRGARETAHLPNKAVDKLEEQHLIRAESRAGGRWYELTHDRFVQPIQASNAAWDRRRLKTVGTSAVIGVALAVAALAAILTTPVLFKQQEVIAAQAQEVVNTAATATVKDIVVQKIAATATVSAESAELVALARQQSDAAQETATVVARKTAVVVSRATAFAVSRVAATANAQATLLAEVPVPVDLPSGGVTFEPTTATAVAPGATTAVTAGTLPAATARPVPTQTAAPTPTATAAPAPAPTSPPPTATPLAIDPRPTSITIGSSVLQKPLDVLRVGNGAQRMAIIGSLHGGEELPAHDLLVSFQQRLASNSLPVPAELTLYVLPSLDPDDLEAKTGFNARGVDLNRNFPILWTAVTCGSPSGRYSAFGGCKADGGGESALSEPESQAARKLIQDNDVHTVLVLNSGINTVSSRNGGDGAGESLALDVRDAFRIPYARSCCANYPVTGQLVDWVESLGRRGVEVNAPPRILQQQQGFDLLTFIIERAAAATCTPTLETGEFALKSAPDAQATEVGVVSPGEEVIVERWSLAADSVAQSAAAVDPWLYVTVSRPKDGREGWMFTRESNAAQPRCSFNIGDRSTYSFPRA